MRIAEGETLTGPWDEPGPKVSPNFREAPTLIPRPDGRGWYLYFEQYPGVQYGLATAPSLAGPWHDVHIHDYSVPEKARHGCMVPIGKAELEAPEAAYGGR